MNVSDLFEDLSYGELSNLNLSVEGSGTIQEESRPKVIRAANDALIDLYGRFTLKKKDVLVEMAGGITFYHLDSQFAESSYNPDEISNPYIKDLLAEPFTDDVVKILQVFDSFGLEVPLNDLDHANSYFTPEANVLQVPRPTDGQSLGIIYQAFHPKLVNDDPEQRIEVPTILHIAFRSYIAYKVFSAVGTQDATAKAQEHLGNYEAQCQKVIDKDLVNTSISTSNERFEKRGWK